MKHLLIILILLAGCSACTKKVYVPIETQSESIRYVEREVVRNLIDTIPVYIEIPAQTTSIITLDTISHIETDYAESFAKWSDGVLTHTLSNKPKSIEKQVEVPRTEIEKRVEVTDTLTVYVPYEVPVEVEVERALTLSESLKLNSWWWFVIGFFCAITYIFRKPLLALIRKVKI